LKIAYFVHDLTDPAVERRVRMLRAGGAQLVLLGFRRQAGPVAEVGGVQAIDLGRTYDSRMAHRAGLALLKTLDPGRWRAMLQGCDVVLARNLEMLAVAVRARDVCAADARLVYECLDIHRLMLGSGVPRKLLRGLERALLRRCDLLVVSSPAFIDGYFTPRQHLATPHLLVENKVFDPAGEPRRPSPAVRPPGPPWKIGWFGVIRCARSLDILTTLARRNPGLVEVVIRGRPALHEFADFEGQVAATPGVSFEGPYRPADLAELYGQVHFTWAIDYFDAGLNSAMLLPNRVYEGALNGSVALALAGVESGRWVAGRNAGVVMDDPLAETEALLRGLTPEAYRTLADEVAKIPVADLAAGPAACAALVESLAA